MSKLINEDGKNKSKSFKRRRNLGKKTSASNLTTPKLMKGIKKFLALESNNKENQVGFMKVKLI